MIHSTRIQWLLLPLALLLSLLLVSIDSVSPSASSSDNGEKEEGHHELTRREELLSLPQKQPSSPHSLIPSIALSSQHHQQHRQLNWDALNDIISRAVLRFPDSELSAGGLTLRVTELQCTNVSVDQVLISFRTPSMQQIQVDTTITGLDMICTARYEFYGLLIVNGSGDLYVESFDNAAVVTTVFESLDYSRYPPHDSYIANCDPTVNINKIDFSNGGFWGFTLETLEGMFRGRFEDLAETRLCEELEIMSNNNMDELLADFQTALGQYPEDIVIDPLAAERLLSAFYPQERLINWQEPGSYPFGYWMDHAWEDTVAFLNKKVIERPEGGPATLDMNANVLLRQHVLDKDGVLIMEIEDKEEDQIVYQGHDKWMQTEVRLHNVKIKGLDTLTMLDPLLTIGKYTLQSQLAWESLSLELDLSVDIRSSTLPDSYISIGDPTVGINERGSVEVGLSQVTAGLALLLALDQDIVEALKVGHFLDKDNILSCFLTSVFHVEVSALSVEAMDLQTPQISGFNTQGLNSIVTNAIQGAFAMYEASMLRSSRAFFQQAIREVVNISLEAQKEQLSQGDKCTFWDLPQPHASVDVRELLLEPEAALVSGGLGTERYGNLFSGFVMPTLQNEVLTNDNVNERFIRPYTTTQSGQEGVLMSTAPLVDFVREGRVSMDIIEDGMNGTDVIDNSNWVTLLGWERFQFQAKDALVYNLDTVSSPVEMCNPLDSQLLGNTLRTGDQTPDRPLRVSMRMLAQAQGIAGSGVPDMINDLELSVTVPSTVFAFDMYVAMNETSLLHFPLKDLDNEFCWLASLTQQQAPALNVARIVAGLASSFTFDLACVSCSSPGGEAIPEVLGIMKDAGLINRFQPYLEDLLADVARGAWDGMNIPTMLQDAPRLCPHHPDYDPEAAPSDEYGVLNSFGSAPRWSRQSVETISAVGFLSVYASLFILAKNQLLQPVPPLQQQPVILSVVPDDLNQTSPGRYADEEGLRLLDWTNLSGTFGPWADSVLVEARQALQNSVMNETLLERRRLHDVEGKSRLLQADSFLHDYLLYDDGTFTFEFDDMQFEFAGIVFSIEQARARGLDSITHLDPFIVVGPQSLNNEVKLLHLDVALDLVVETGPDKHNLTVDFAFRDLAVEFPLLLAMDLDKLGQIELGSLLKINQILPCLLQGAHEVYIPHLNVTIGTMMRPTVEGIFSPDLQALVTSMNEALFDSFGDELALALPGIFDSTIKRTFNTRLQQYVSQVDSALCTVDAGGDLVDFRDLFLSPNVSKGLGGTGTQQYGDLFHALHEVMKEELETKDGEPPSINSFISAWIAEHFNTSGAVEIPGNLLDTTASMKLAGLDAVLAFQLGAISLENVDTLGSPLSLLDPLGPHTLNNTASLGVGGKPLKVKARLVLAVSDDAEMQVRNEVDVSVELYAANAVATVLLRIAEDAFLKFPLKDTSNIYCWLATVLGKTDDIHGISLVDQSLSLGHMDLNVSCVSCTSPQFGDLISDLYAPANADEATETVLQTLSQILDGDAIQDFLDQIVAESSSKCPHSDEYDPAALMTASGYLQNQAKPFAFTDFTSRDDSSSYFNIASAVFASFLLICFIIGKLLIHRSNKKWRESLSEEGLFLLRRQKAKEREQEAELNMYSTSLFRSPHIPRNIRWAVPVVILLNIGLYIGGHLGVLSTVDLEVLLAGEEFTIHNFMEFSFIDSTANTYVNGGIEMSIMLWIFTGIWPYIKLLASLFLWLVPPRCLSIANRGKMLLWLDALTKLSIIDIFTLILFLAVLLVYIGGPDENLDAEGALYSMKVIVIPGASVYCIVIAQRISRVSTKFFLDYHEKVVVAAREARRKGDDASAYLEDCLNDNDAMVNQPDPNEDSGREVDDDGQSSSGISFGSFGSREGSNDDNFGSDSLQPQEAKDSTRAPMFGNSAQAERESPMDQEMSTVLDRRLPPTPEHVGDSDNDKECSSVGDSLSCTNAEAATERCSLLSRLKSIFLGGQMGVAFGFVAVVALLIVGCIFAPSVSADFSDLWALALESGTTFEEAATQYGVFSIVSAVLLRSRFVLDTTWDYVALGFLMVVAFISVGILFFISIYHFIRRLFKEGWSAVRPAGKPKAYELPSYLRLYAYKHFEIYVVAVVIGCWQLGSVAIYAIHLYCSILDSVYRVLTYIGLAQSSTAQCFEAQMTLIDNLLIFFGALLILLAKFGVQCSTQYQKNIREACDLLRHQDHDVERLSTLWNTPSSAKRSFWSSRSSVLNQTATTSFSDLNSSSCESPSSYVYATTRSSSQILLAPQSPGERDSVSLSTLSVSPERKGQDLDRIGELTMASSDASEASG